jgi:spore germination protein KC
MKPKHYFLLICLLLLPALSGCWDLLEVDKRTFVTTIGIDTNPRGEATVTVQIPLANHMTPSTASSGAQPQGKQFSTVSFSAKTVGGALNALQAKTYRDLVLEQNKSIIISEEVARQGVKALTEFLIRNPKAPPQALVFVANNHTAREILSSTPIQETLPGMEFNQASQLKIKTTWTYYTPIWEFEKNLTHASTDAIAPLIDFDPDDKTYLVAGLAVFNGDHLAGKLDMAETQFFGLLSGLMRAGGITLNLPGNETLTLRNVLGGTSIKVEKTKDGLPFFLVKTSITGSLNELISARKEVTPSYSRRLQSAIEKELTSKLTEVVKKLQSYNSDVVNFGEELRVQHQDLWKQIKWKEIYPAVPFEIKVKATIERDGVYR